MCYTYLFTKQICLIFHFITCGFINFNHINWKNKGEKNRNKANSSDPTINKWHSIFMQRFLMSAYFHKRGSNSNCHLLFTSKIWNTAIPFSGAIVFTNLWNIESVLKLLPDLLSHSTKLTRPRPQSTWEQGRGNFIKCSSNPAKRAKRTTTRQPGRLYITM